MDAGAAKFFLLEDGKTGVFALGSFLAANLDESYAILLFGLQALAAKGATRLIVDVVSAGSRTL